jgi:hypothetical protein
MTANEFVKSSQYVGMCDGVKIAVDAYIPQKEESSAKFPVLFTYHPYSRAVIDPETGQFSTTVSGSPSFFSFFTSHGYAIVVADMRGSGASFGSRADMSPQLGKDGKEIVDWIESQPWCNGNVGMYGGSYAAWTQIATAIHTPKALKCIMPEMVGFDGFDGGLGYSGGIYRRQLIDMWSGLMYLVDRAAYLPQSPTGMPVLPVAPVVDEDGDSDLADEIPLYPPRAPFFVFGPPTYKDGKKRNDIYYNAVKEHLQNPEMKQWAPAARFSDGQCGSQDYTWTDIGASEESLRTIAQSGIAIYNVGGWFDLNSRGTTQWYSSLSSSNPSRMFFLPMMHGSLDLFPAPMVGPYLKHFGEDQAALTKFVTEERLRFFDRYLKGMKNGIEQDEPVLIYVMNGGGLRKEKEWPLSRQVKTRYYLQAGGGLSVEGPGEGTDEYEADLSHDSRQGEKGDSRWNGMWMSEDIIRRSEKHKKCIVFTSSPLHGDREVTGHPIVSLWVASTARDADFFVYLEDISEEGEAFYVTEGMARAGFCHMVDSASEHAQPVLPKLPYHSYREDDYEAEVFTGGRKVLVTTDLYPTSWVFKKGHRIAISIACSDWPSYDLNPQLSPRNKPDDPGTTMPTITFFHNSEFSSYVELPVIPSDASHVEPHA